MTDPLFDYLSKLRVPDAVKADLWDAYTEAADEQDLIRRLTPIGVEDPIKADLFDLRRPSFGAQTKPTPAADPVSGASPAPAQDASGLTLPQRIAKTGFNIAQGWGDAVTGAAKSALGMVEEGGNLIRKIPGVRDWEEALGLYIDTDWSNQPSNRTQQLAKTAADIALTVAPGTGITKVAKAASAAAPAGAKLLTRAAVEAAGGAGLAKLQGGDPALAAGLSAAVPVVGAAVRGAKNLIPKGKVAPEVAEAIKFADDAGIPVDMATRSGSRLARSVQERSADSLGGARIAEEFKGAQSDALIREAEKLAGRTGTASTVSPEMAGRGMRDALYGGVKAQSKNASEAYGKLRAMEAADPVRFAVDMDEAKAILKPLAAQLENAVAAAGTLVGPRARAAEVVRGIMQAPNTLPLSAVDEALSGIKELARNPIPEMKTGSQAIASQAVMALENVVRKTAAAAAPEVMPALEAGRAATKVKHEIFDVLESLADEPVQAFKQATFRNDAGIERLRNVAKYAPGEMQKVGRAWLDDVFGASTAEGTYENAKTALTAWRNLGDETKKLLFPDAALRKDLDAFFLFGKKAAEVANTSGTSRALTALNVGSTVATYPIAKIMFNPQARKAVMNGMAKGQKVEDIMQQVARVLGTQSGGDR